MEKTKRRGRPRKNLKENLPIGPPPPLRATLNVYTNPTTIVIGAGHGEALNRIIPPGQAAVIKVSNGQEILILPPTSENKPGRRPRKELEAEDG